MIASSARGLSAREKIGIVDLKINITADFSSVRSKKEAMYKTRIYPRHFPIFLYLRVNVRSGIFVDYVQVCFSRFLHHL